MKLTVDTRNKILTAEQAAHTARAWYAQGGRLRVAVSYVDPLLDDVAAWLAGLVADGAALLLVVTDPPDPLLAASARAELGASLAAVRWVTAVPPSELDALLAALDADEVSDNRTEEDGLRARFAAYVRERAREAR
jgi:hypothetical protein